ncbi:Ribonuclease H-like domain [Cinara cedri]|uniref:Ribonuclease H-like domain n=1 Tax=Cinara cedri TaxID=506608 RepID=A0A5E4MDH6_9HEMI|nr:Ribonuclease H-like domain [Cinara cedri]
MDCTTALIKKFSCARTKCESIILNVLAPFAMDQIIDELKAVNFATVMIGTSNHKNLKIVPIFIRYFDPKTGVQIKVLEFTNLKGETSDILSSYIIEILTKHKLSHKIIAFTSDNCNTNFGGAARRGTKNVLTILNNNLKTNISGIGCAAHILHNAMQTSTDILPIDVKYIVHKIFQYFYIYTVRVEDKCPTILKSFFSDPVAIIWFHFIQSQLKVVCDTIKRIEGDNKSACKVSEELEWGNSFEELKIFRWTQLINYPTWNDIQKSLIFILQNNKQIGWNVDEDILFDEYNHVVNVINENLKECQNKYVCVEEIWCAIYTILNSKSILINNFWNIVEYSLAMPGTNAAIERVFSITNLLWTGEKNRFLVPTIKSIILLKNRFKKYSCNDFYDFLLTQPKLLNAISPWQKYSNDTFDNKGHDEQLTSTQ